MANSPQTVLQKHFTQKNAITLKIDDESRSFVYLEGGDLEGGAKFKALANSGLGVDDVFKGYECKGKVVPEYDLMAWLIEANKKIKNKTYKTIQVIHSQTNSTDGGFTSKRVFNGVAIVDDAIQTMRMPKYGSDTMLELNLSLNDEDEDARDVIQINQ